MTALLPATPDVRAEARPSSGRLVLALARPEARRLLRTPLVWIGLALTVFFTWATMQSPDDWSGARYMVAPVLVGPWLATLSFAVAGSFHRERSGLAADAPVGEEVRSLGLLGGAAVLVLLVAVVDRGRRGRRAVARAASTSATSPVAPCTRTSPGPS